MASDYTITQVKNDLTGMFHGQSLSKITNINAMLERAGRKVIARIDPQATKRRVNITLYDDVFDYAAQSDMKDFLDLRPQGYELRTDNDNFLKRFSERFDLKKEDNTFHIKWADAIKSLRISKILDRTAIRLHTMNALTDDGAWTAANNASGIAQDKIVKVTGTASVRFNLAALGSSGNIDNTTFAQKDLTDHDEISSIFKWVFILANPSSITSFTLRWGNDLTANYWELAVTETHLAQSFATGWNLLRFDWASASETGTVTVTEIDSLRASLAYNGTAHTNIRIDDIFSSIGQAWDLIYYSNFLFRSSAGVWARSISSDSDLVNLDVDAYNIFLFEAAIEGARQIMGEDAGDDISEWKRELNGDPQTGALGLYEVYTERNPSEKQDVISTYYDL